MKTKISSSRRAPDFQIRRVLSRNFHLRRIAGVSAAALGLLSWSNASAQVIAGIDNWDSTTAPTVSVVAPGVTATATASASGGWTNNESSGRGSSKDGTWGTFNLGIPASTITNVGSANFTLTNGKTDGEVTITITNNGSSDINLDKFHFDAVAFRNNAARAYALNVLAGSDITEGNVFTSEDDVITSLNGALKTDDLDSETHDQHDDIDIDLTGLADSTLEVGGTAIIQIAFSSGTGSGSGHHLFLDNVAVTTVPNTSNELVITSVPASATAATDFSVTVEAQDGNGSPITVSQATDITLSSSGAGALSNFTATIPAGSSSVELVNVQSNLVETITLTAFASSGDEILPSAPSSPIDILLGEASQLVIETAADGSGVEVTDRILFLGDFLTVYAISRDAGGNFIENVIPVWSLENITGEVIVDDLIDNMDGSASLEGYSEGTATLRATFGTLPVADSGVISIQPFVSRWDGGGGNSSWQTAGNWVADILPAFDNQSDLFFFDSSTSRRFTYIGADIAVRSINFDEFGNGQLTMSLVLPGNAQPANLTFDTDSETAPAEFNVTADSVDPITLGFYATTQAGAGDIILADDLLVTHNGGGVLTLNADIREEGGQYGITKAGTGLLVISGNNSYTGNTTVTDGTLRVTGSSIADTATLTIEGGVVDVAADERVVGLSLPGMGNMPDGEYGSTDSGVANPDDVNFTGLGKIIVGPPPAGGEIIISEVSRTGTTLTLTFTSTGNVDVYRSSDLINWGAPYAVDQPSGSYTDNAADGDKYFYILVSAGDPAP